MRVAIVVLALVLPSALLAQPRCTRGKPCGNTCIAATKTCHVGTRPATPPRPAPAPAAPRTESSPLVVSDFFRHIRTGGTTHYVIIPYSQQINRGAFDDAVLRICRAAPHRDCAIYFFGLDRDVPTSFPLTPPHDRLALARYTQSGRTGAFEFTYLRDGLPPG